MEYRKLGKSGIQISALSFGSWITFGKQIKDNTAQDLIAEAYEHGVNFFDNAEIYAQGQSEIVMGNALHKLKYDRTSYMVSSKLFFGDGGKLPNQIGLSRKHIVEGTEKALKRLKVDYIDLLFCHRPDKNTPIEETVWSMHNLICQGKILYWGTSEWSAQEIMEAHYFARQNHLIGPLMEQPQYNMFTRDKFEVEYSQLYKNFGLGTTIWSPLASGLLTGKYNDGVIPAESRLAMEGFEWLKDRTLSQQRIAKVVELTALAQEIGTTLPKMSIAWCLKNPNVSTVILGAFKKAQLSETLHALDTVALLTPEIMEKIEAILENAPVHPQF